MFISDEYDSAVLEAIGDRLLFLNDVEAEDDGNQDTIDEEKKNIRELKQWADSLTDRKYRKAVYGWIRFAENGLKEYEQEFKTHKNRNEYDKWEREENEAEKRIAAIAQTLERPK